MQYPNSELRRILFIDIETASQHSSFEDLSDTAKMLWSKKVKQLTKVDEMQLTEEEVATFYNDRAAIYAEYAQVVCISVGFIVQTDEEQQLRLKVISAPTEREILIEFSELLDSHYYNKSLHFICGHNIKEFDIPFLCRRYLINRIEIPELLDVAGHKPWQVHHLLDTMEMWKFGDYKYYTSLDTLCMGLEIESPKSKMNGSEVSAAYWDGKIDQICLYAKRDLIATVQVYLRLIQKSIIDENSIIG